MWLASALVRSYMHSFPPAAMLALSGFPSDAAKVRGAFCVELACDMETGVQPHVDCNSHTLAQANTKLSLALEQNDFNMFWHERFTLCVPQKLQDYLFPFMEVFRARIRTVSGHLTLSSVSNALQIRTGQPTPLTPALRLPYTLLSTCPTQMSDKERRNEVSVTRVLAMLDVLAVTTVQDLLWLAVEAQVGGSRPDVPDPALAELVLLARYRCLETCSCRLMRPTLSAHLPTIVSQESEENAVYMDMPIMKYMMKEPEFAERVKTVKLAKDIGVSTTASSQQPARTVEGLIMRQPFVRV